MKKEKEMKRLNNQVKEFLNQIRSRFGDNLVKVILYGSRARGDFDESSDYDLIMIFHKVTPEIKSYITDLEDEFFYEYSVIISAICLSEADLIHHRYDPFLMNIQKEGIII